MSLKKDTLEKLLLQEVQKIVGQQEEILIALIKLNNFRLSDMETI